VDLTFDEIETLKVFKSIRRMIGFISLTPTC